MSKISFPLLHRSPKFKWVLLSITILLALGSLVAVYNLQIQLRDSELQKVKLWAAAISQKAQVMNATEDFFEEVAIEEHAKMEFYTRAQQMAFTEQLSTKASLFFTDYITANHTIPVIITDQQGMITAYNNIELPEGTTHLSGQMLEDFTQEEPIPYVVWGMPFTLFYKESRIYTDLHAMLDNLTQSFLDEIKNNAVAAPVLIVDSLQEFVLGSGNLKESEFDAPDKLSYKLCEMENENPPIEIRLPDAARAYVFYESTPLLKALRWVPILYLFIIFVIILVSFNLFRTARNMEQNRIWVGMAKETAHQLGTPISSLIAWNEYLTDKTLTPAYSKEIRKDLDRLETITHRFSKIGSVPELKQEPICATIQGVITYLQNRSSKKIKFVTNFPQEDMLVPLNKYLFEWVIENIAKNAIDAMNGEGTFTTIVTSDNDHIIIDLSDTGKGMSSSVQKHIFDSGFTTKQRGWGLGLSLARRIINEYHNGKIFLKYSIEGQGSVFRILLNKTIDNKDK